MIRILGLITGYAFLFLGILGLFLPILQGFLFIAVGLIILSRHTSWAGRGLIWLKARHPAVESLIGKAEALADRWGERIAGFARRRFGTQER